MLVVLDTVSKNLRTFVKHFKNIKMIGKKSELVLQFVRPTQKKYNCTSFPNTVDTAFLLKADF